MSKRKLQELRQEQQQVEKAAAKKWSALLGSTISGRSAKLKTVKPSGMPMLLHRSSGDEHVRPAVAVAMDFAAKKKAQVYTGDKMLGVTVLHKSCLQPVFSQQEAVDAATMRR